MGGVVQACGYNFPRQGSWMAERDFAARKAEEKEKEAITYRPLRLTFPFMVSCQSCALPHQDQWLMASAQGHRQLMSQGLAVLDFVP